MAVSVTNAFAFDPEGAYFRKPSEKVSIRSYDAVLLRLPHPVAPEFWNFLEKEFPSTLFINRPSGMMVAGNKKFMLNFPSVCPSMCLCDTLSEIETFKSKFPIVLKPVASYGGKGIVKISGDQVSFSEGGKSNFQKFAQEYERNPQQYLAVKYLENVGKGDKRIVLCCGEVLGAAIRYPAPGNWVCNVAQGGSSAASAPDENEIEIIKTIDPGLQKLGVLFYGIDTLMGDDGRRVLSEINALSIGGLHAMKNAEGIPAIKRASDLLWEHIHQAHN